MEDGEKFGRLTVTMAYASPAKALVQCDCGTECEIRRGDLVRGVSRSCGCLRAEVTSARFRRHGSGYEDYQYRLWRRIKVKCYQSSYQDYRYYRGRGTSMPGPWLKFFPPRG